MVFGPDGIYSDLCNGGVFFGMVETTKPSITVNTVRKSQHHGKSKPPTHHLKADGQVSRRLEKTHSTRTGTACEKHGSGSSIPCFIRRFEFSPRY
jgi:hypothetical protein